MNSDVVLMKSIIYVRCMIRYWIVEPGEVYKLQFAQIKERPVYECSMPNSVQLIHNTLLLRNFTTSGFVIKLNSTS